MNDFNYDLVIGLLDEYSEMLKVVRDSEHELIKSDDEVKVEHLEQIGKMARRKMIDFEREYIKEKSPWRMM